MKVRVWVTLKAGVLDPAGRTVARTLRSLGFESVEDVRIGRYIELSIREPDPAKAKEQADQMCRKLLVSSVVEDYRVEL